MELKKKKGQNRKKLPCHAPKFEFSTTPGSSISAKILPYDFRAKSRWGPPRVHLGANGVPLELKKNGSKSQKIAMPQNSNFRLPRGHRFRPKFDLTVMAPNHGRELLGSILLAEDPGPSIPFVVAILPDFDEFLLISSKLDFLYRCNRHPTPKMPKSTLCLPPAR